jgi:hypothetical protein
MTDEAAGTSLDAHDDDLGIAPFAIGTGLALLFVAGLMLASHAADGYSYGAGLGFAAFSLLVAARYFHRLLPA